MASHHVVFMRHTIRKGGFGGTRAIRSKNHVTYLQDAIGRLTFIYLLHQKLFHMPRYLLALSWTPSSTVDTQRTDPSFVVEVSYILGPHVNLI